MALEEKNIEARPVWKPMHLQPVFAEYEYVGGEVAADLFAHGLCLPSGSALSESELCLIVDTIRSVHDQAYKLRCTGAPIDYATMRSSVSHQMVSNLKDHQ